MCILELTRKLDTLGVRFMLNEVVDVQLVDVLIKHGLSGENHNLQGLPLISESRK